MKKITESNWFSINRQLTFYSIPILLGMMCELFYTLADTFFISIIDKTDTAIISGVGLIFPIIFLLTSVDQGIGSGISTIVAISVGEKNNRQIRKTADTGFNLSLYLGGIVLLFFFFFVNIILDGISGSGVSQRAKDIGAEYLIYVLPGFLFMFLVQARFSVLQGLGKTKFIGIGMVISSLINVALDPVMIFTFNLGVKGASIATVISQLILFIIVSIVYRKNGFKDFKLSHLIKFDNHLLKRIIRIGIPSSLSFIILSASFMVYNFFIGNISESALNAYTLVQRFEGILVTPALAFAIGLSIMTGQNFGAKQYKKVNDIFINGTLFITIITVVICGIYMLFAKSIFVNMTGNPEVLSLILNQVYYVTIPASIGFSIAFCSSASLQAIEKPISSFILNGLRTLFLGVPFILMLQSVLPISIMNIWGGITLASVVASLMGFIWFKKIIGRISR